MEDEIGGFLVDLNKKEKNTQPQANPFNKNIKQAVQQAAASGFVDNQIMSDATAANSSGQNSKNSKVSLV